MWQEIREIKSDDKSLRQFGWVMSVFFLVLEGVYLYKHHRLFYYFVSVAIFFAVVALVRARLLLPLQKVWMALAVILGWVMSRVILCALFYLVLTPIALIIRLSGKDLLSLRRVPAATFWVNRKEEASAKADCEKQY